MSDMSFDSLDGHWPIIENEKAMQAAQDLLWSSPPDTNKLIEFLNRYTMETGSKAYGLADPMDDDRYCDYNTFAWIKAIVCKRFSTLVHDSCESQYFGGIHFTLYGITYNVFPIPYDELDTIEAVTVCMRMICCRWPTLMKTDKKERIRMFESLRAALKPYGRREECATDVC